MGLLPLLGEFGLHTDHRATLAQLSWKCKLTCRRGVVAAQRYIGPMDLKDQPTKRICSVADALSTVGDRYSLLIVREIGYGYVRFKDLVAYTGAPRDVLTSRLRRLEE